MCGGACSPTGNYVLQISDPAQVGPAGLRVVGFGETWRKVGPRPEHHVTPRNPTSDHNLAWTCHQEERTHPHRPGTDSQRPWLPPGGKSTHGSAYSIQQLPTTSRSGITNFAAELQILFY